MRTIPTIMPPLEQEMGDFVRAEFCLIRQWGRRGSGSCQRWDLGAANKRGRCGGKMRGKWRSWGRSVLGLHICPLPYMPPTFQLLLFQYQKMLNVGKILASPMLKVGDG